MSKQKLLFICTANVARSRTAEDMLRNSTQYEVRSAGLKQYQSTGQLVTQELLDWADTIFVMDEAHDHHLTLLRGKFNIKDKKVYILWINDIYPRGDKVLIETLKTKLACFGIKT